MKVRVYYEDTDAGGIVYHTNYIKYCERARSEIFFERCEIPTHQDKSGFVVRHIDANFLGMAVLGDTLEVRTQVIKEKNASVYIKQTIFKEEKKIFEMDVQLVFILNGKPAIIPSHLHNIFE